MMEEELPELLKEYRARHKEVLTPHEAALLVLQDTQSKELADRVENEMLLNEAATMDFNDGHGQHTAR